MTRNVTKEQARRSLRPDVHSFVANGEPTDSQITAEQTRLNALSDREFRVMQRTIEPAPLECVHDRIDALEDRIEALENRNRNNNGNNNSSNNNR